MRSRRHGVPHASIAMIIVAITMSLAGLARAGDPDEEAKKAYKSGTELFENESYREAADSFRTAYSLKPNWKIFYNIGQCEILAKRHGLALDAFESYIAQGGDDIPPNRRDEVLEEIDRLRKIVGLVELEAPDGAVVLVDDFERGKAPLPGPMKMAAGMDHRLIVRLGDEILMTRIVRVTGEQTINITLEEDDSDGGDVTEETPGAPIPPEPEPASSKLKTVGWIALGAGAAMAIGGGITGGVAMSVDGDLEKSCPDEQCAEDQWEDVDRMNSLATATNVLLIAGGAVAAAGITILIIDAAKDGEQDPGDGETAVVPTVAPGFAGVTWTGRF